MIIEKHKKELVFRKVVQIQPTSFLNNELPHIPASKYLSKVNNKNIGTCEICLKLSIKTQNDSKCVEQLFCQTFINDFI